MLRAVPASLSSAVARHARDTPDSVAVQCADGRVLAYGALADRVDRLAGVLADSGVSAGGLVGVLLDRGPDLPVAALAAFRAGVGYLPLDPAHPPHRLRAVVEDARPALVLTEERHAATARALGTPTVDVRASATRTSGPAHTVRASDTAYVIYTSGSTGAPKGVVVTHGALAESLAWMVDDFPLDRDDRVLLRTTPTFDVSILELLWPIAQGARLVVPDRRADGDPEHLAENARRLGATNSYFVPSQLACLLAEPATASWTSLRRAFVVGEQFPGELLRRMWRTWPEAEIVNAYGPTEAAVVTLWHRCTAEDASRERVPIGRFAGRTTGEVVEPDTLRPVAAGEVGDLLLGGPQLAVGYHGRPDLTAERFVSTARGRRYRTGDLVRDTGGGVLEFLRRSDRQVKVRGGRVELDEVEAAALAEPGVRSARAEVRAHPADGNQVVVAWVAAEPGTTRQRLRTALAGRLPAYMVPDAVVVMAQFPLLNSGKLDHSALPDPFGAVETTTAAPDPSLCGLVEKAWEQVSGIPIGSDEGFLQAGGNSLLLLQLRGRLRALGYRRLRVLDLVEHPTPARLAEFLRTSPSAAEE